MSRQTDESRRIELILPMRTVLLVAAAAGVLAAFAVIGESFLVVFVGIFLALVFEYPVRFVMAKTNMSRGLAATVTVLGAALAVLVIALLFLVPLVGGVRDVLQALPETVEQLRASDELSGSVGDSGASPSSRCSEDGWVAKPAAWSAPKSHVPLWSPVNMRPVRLPPCAAGASPTSSTRASGSPKPGSGRAQYVCP